MNLFYRGKHIAQRALSRAKGFRRDDQAQVMVVTAVMAFVTVLMAIYTTNASILLFDRMLAQNSVDAAADSFAAYQARGLNLTQHLNDVHYGANIAIFALEAVAYGGRIACPAVLATTFPVPNYPGYRTCCQLARQAGELLDNLQDGISDAILIIQDVINVVFPILATLSANDIARANGADNLLTAAGEVLGQFGNLFGIDLDFLEDAVDNVAEYVPVYAFPLKPGQIIDLGMEKVNPDYLFWDDMNILEGLAIGSDISCAFAVDFSAIDQPNDGIGWPEDEYYCGGPAANTWIVGKQRRTVLPRLEQMAWLNPKMDEPEQVAGVHAFEDNYAVFEGRGMGTSSTEFRNPAFFAVASCQVGGDPVMDRTFLNDSFSEYARPELITVQIPGARFLFVWH